MLKGFCQRSLPLDWGSCSGARGGGFLSSSLRFCSSVFSFGCFFFYTFIYIHYTWQAFYKSHILLLSCFLLKNTATRFSSSSLPFFCCIFSVCALMNLNQQLARLLCASKSRHVTHMTAQHLNTRRRRGCKVCLLCADTGAVNPATWLFPLCRNCSIANKSRI